MRVIPFPTPKREPTVEQMADAWEGVVRVMEANGRGYVEISIDDARRIARMARDASR